MPRNAFCNRPLPLSASFTCHGSPALHSTLRDPRLRPYSSAQFHTCFRLARDSHDALPPPYRLVSPEVQQPRPLTLYGSAGLEGPWLALRYTVQYERRVRRMENGDGGLVSGRVTGAAVHGRRVGSKLRLRVAVHGTSADGSPPDASGRTETARVGFRILLRLVREAAPQTSLQAA